MALQILRARQPLTTLLISVRGFAKQAVKPADPLPKLVKLGYKRTAGGFALFVLEHLNKVPTANLLKPRLSLHFLNEEWRHLPTNKQQAYIQKSASPPDRLFQRAFNNISDVVEKANKEEVARLKIAKASKPKGPKRLPSPYILFSLDARQKIIQENPNIKQTEILKLVGAQWRNADEATKKKYTDKYAETKAAKAATVAQSSATTAASATA